MIRDYDPLCLQNIISELKINLTLLVLPAQGWFRLQKKKKKKYNSAAFDSVFPPLVPLPGLKSGFT